MEQPVVSWPYNMPGLLDQPGKTKMTHYELVTINENNVPTTTSLKVAEAFGKTHGNVIRKIESLECSVEFARINFDLGSYLDGNQQERKMYELIRNGFSFLDNKMNGPKAAEFTERFIGAFNFPSNLTASVFR
jgi:Rha family phage regulatory protein